MPRGLAAAHRIANAKNNKIVLSSVRLAPTKRRPVYVLHTPVAKTLHGRAEQVAREAAQAHAERAAAARDAAHAQAERAAKDAAHAHAEREAAAARMEAHAHAEQEARAAAWAAAQHAHAEQEAMARATAQAAAHAIPTSHALHEPWHQQPASHAGWGDATSSWGDAVSQQVGTAADNVASAVSGVWNVAQVFGGAVGRAGQMAGNVASAGLGAATATTQAILENVRKSQDIGVANPSSAASPPSEPVPTPAIGAAS